MDIIKNRIKAKTEERIKELKQYRKSNKNISIINEVISNQFFVENMFFTPVIYFLRMKDVVVYVGQTSSFMSRISQHILDNQKLFDNFTYIDCSKMSFKERLNQEKKYIRKHKPVYNIVHNKI